LDWRRTTQPFFCLASKLSFFFFDCSRWFQPFPFSVVLDRSFVLVSRPFPRVSIPPDFSISPRVLNFPPPPIGLCPFCPCFKKTIPAPIVPLFDLLGGRQLPPFPPWVFGRTSTNFSSCKYTFVSFFFPVRGVPFFDPTVEMNWPSWRVRSVLLIFRPPLPLSL